MNCARLIMAATSRSSGWQRIGVVLSVIWILSVSSYAICEFMQAKADKKELVDRIFVKWVDDKSNERILTAVSREWIGTPVSPTQKTLDNLPDTIVLTPIIPSINVYALVAYMFLPVIISWMGIYTILFTIRWVVDGFRNNR